MLAMYIWGNCWLSVCIPKCFLDIADEMVISIGLDDGIFNSLPILIRKIIQKRIQSILRISILYIEKVR